MQTEGRAEPPDRGKAQTEGRPDRGQSTEGRGKPQGRAGHCNHKDIPENQFLIEKLWRMCYHFHNKLLEVGEHKNYGQKEGINSGRPQGYQ